MSQIIHFKCNNYIFTLISSKVEEMVSVGKELVSHNGGDLADCRYYILIRVQEVCVYAALIFEVYIIFYFLHTEWDSIGLLLTL